MNDPALDAFMMWFLSFALLCLGGQDTAVFLGRWVCRKVRRAALRRRNRAAYRRLLPLLHMEAGT